MSQRVETWQLRARFAAQAAAEADNSDCSIDWMAAQIGHHIHDPYELYEKVASS